jgi:hypothetical protein
MKKIITVIVCTLLTGLLFANPPKGPAKKGMSFGKKTTSKGAITIDQLASIVKDKATTVKVKGTVSDVCTKEGCWLKLKTADGDMMVKMKDHSFLVPLDLNGKEIVVQGTAKIKTTTVKELQHYAEDAGKSEEEINAITEPKKEIVISAIGLLVL